MNPIILALPGYFNAVYVIGAFFDPSEQAVTHFRSGVDRYAHAQEVNHQHGQALDEKHLRKISFIVIYYLGQFGSTLLQLSSSDKPSGIQNYDNPWV